MAGDALPAIAAACCPKFFLKEWTHLSKGPNRGERPRRTREGFEHTQIGTAIRSIRSVLLAQSYRQL